MKIKYILLTEIISPYRIPVFNEIARTLNDNFLVFFLGETENRRQWRINKDKIRFNYKVLPRILLQGRNSEPYFLNPGIIYRLFKHSPDIVITGGYHQPGFLSAMIYAKLFKKRIILWCESNKYDLRTNNPLKAAYKRWFIRNASSYIVPGRASYEYIVSLGASAERIHMAPNAVDNDYFSRLCEEYKLNKERLKREKGYPGRLIIYVGRIIEAKGVLDLIKVFQRLCALVPDLGILLVGSGPDKERYMDFCASNNIKNVFFTGFIQPDELPLYYALSDVFVLPTHHEPWGLVLNEAMICGLPVISSAVAGAAADLVINGRNGHIFKKQDLYALTQCLMHILNNKEERISMGKESLEIIKGYSPLKCASGFLEAIKFEGFASYSHA